MLELEGDGVLDWFAHSCQCHGAAPALEHENRTLSYSQLERRSAQIAAALQAHGVKPESIVAVILEDPLEWVSAAIGVLRAGCVFAPLDPAGPAARLPAIAHELKPDVYLGDTPSLKLVSTLAQTQETPRIAPLPQSTDTGAAVAPAPLSPESLCAIFYDSSLTGIPLGVASRLKCFSQCVRWELERFGVQASGRTPLLSRPTTDAFLYEIFVSLASGGTLCLPPASQAKMSLEQLVEWLRQSQTTRWYCSAEFFAEIAACALGPVQLPTLTHVFVRGAPLPYEAARRWLETFAQQVQVVALYGTPEVGVAKLYHALSRDDLAREYIPLGQPVRGAKALLMDEDGSPCAPGRLGELWIRSPYLALGYYRNPEATQQAFIKNPFSSLPDDMVYKTGDLGRLLADGTCQYIGRKDRRVQYGGGLLDLDEIELELRQHAGVEAAAVTVYEDAQARRRLTAYIVPGAEAFNAHALRECLRSRLPPQAIPRHFVALQTLPRTAAGTLDRCALPPPPQDEADYAAPSSPVEEQLAQIWREVLGQQRLSVNANFFDLGGHSLLATQIISRIRDCFQVELPVRSIFEAPTIAGLALAIVQQLVEGTDQELTGLLSGLTTQAQAPAPPQ